MSNPFEIKKYIINESIYNSSCDNIKPSHINEINTYDPNNENLMNLTEIQIYLFNETSKLIINIQLANMCDESGLLLNKNTKNNTNTKWSEDCSATFKNFSKNYLNNLKQSISAGEKYTSQIKSGSNPFSTFYYTDEYIKSKTTPNDWKPLCQRFSDIGQMLKDFSDILYSISNSSKKTEFIDKYNDIVKLYKQNNIIRKELEYKLDIISNGERYKDSKEFSDSTIYVSVLWTILVILILFYIFKNI